VILLTRLGGPVFALNQDLIERADCTPDTVITLVDGTKYVVCESLPELVELIREFRATVIGHAQELDTGAAPRPHLRPAVAPAGADPTAVTSTVPAAPAPASTVVPLHRRDR
jgi:flagellar protein FlbD